MEEIFIKGIGLAILYAIGFSVIILIVLGLAAFINKIDEWKREREIERYLDINGDKIREQLNNSNQSKSNKSFDDVLNNSLQHNNIRRI